MKIMLDINGYVDYTVIKMRKNKNIKGGNEMTHSEIKTGLEFLRAINAADISITDWDDRGNFEIKSKDGNREWMQQIKAVENISNQLRGV